MTTTRVTAPPRPATTRTRRREVHPQQQHRTRSEDEAPPRSRCLRYPPATIGAPACHLPLPLATRCSPPSSGPTSRKPPAQAGGSSSTRPTPANPPMTWTTAGTAPAPSASAAPPSPPASSPPTTSQHSEAATASYSQVAQSPASTGEHQHQQPDADTTSPHARTPSPDRHRPAPAPALPAYHPLPPSPHGRSDEQRRARSDDHRSIDLAIISAHEVVDFEIDVHDALTCGSRGAGRHRGWSEAPDPAPKLEIFFRGPIPEVWIMVTGAS
ncbi:Basic proline-rich protein precursor [Pseudonocardia sp. Ae707_Ps1]|nr:Basic proline-rich protein precursor [Pseudonocardia sp. Ae707_Ps1]